MIGDFSEQSLTLSNRSFNGTCKCYKAVCATEFAPGTPGTLSKAIRSLTSLNLAIPLPTRATFPWTHLLRGGALRLHQQLRRVRRGRFPKPLPPSSFSFLHYITAYESSWNSSARNPTWFDQQHPVYSTIESCVWISFNFNAASSDNWVSATAIRVNELSNDSLRHHNLQAGSVVLHIV